MVWFVPLCRRTLSLPSTNSTRWSSPWSCSRTHHPYAVADAPWADDTNSPPADQESKKRATAGSLCVWWFAVVLVPVLLPPLWLKVTALYNLKAKKGAIYPYIFGDADNINGCYSLQLHVTSCLRQSRRSKRAGGELLSHLLEGTLNCHRVQALRVSNAPMFEGAHPSTESSTAFHIPLINPSALVASHTLSFNCIADFTYIYVTK